MKLTADYFNHGDILISALVIAVIATVFIILLFDSEPIKIEKENV